LVALHVTTSELSTNRQRELFLSQLSWQRCEAITSDHYLAAEMDISLSGVPDNQELWGGMQQWHEPGRPVLLRAVTVSAQD
jgi:hypothetical protein